MFYELKEGVVLEVSYLLYRRMRINGALDSGNIIDEGELMTRSEFFDHYSRQQAT